MIQAFIAATVFYLLLLVGTKVRIADFKPIIAHPAAITLVILAHLIFVPVIVSVIVWLIPLDQWIALGMILIAASPTGAISNYYVTLARGNAATSVALCGVPNLVAFLTAPVTCWLIGKFFSIEALGVVPLASMVGQTIPTVLLPVVLGLAIRHLYPSWTFRHQQFMERLSFVAIAILIVVIFVSRIDFLTPAIVGSAMVMAILFTILLSALGWAIAHFAAASLGESQRSAILFGFPARNLGLAALLAANVFGMIELATFGAVFFVVQIFFLLPLATVLRHKVQSN